MEFVQNKGQWDKKVNYKGDFANGSFFLESKGFTVLMHKADDVIKLSEYTHNGSSKKSNSKESVPDAFIKHPYPTITILLVMILNNGQVIVKYMAQLLIKIFIPTLI